MISRFAENSDNAIDAHICTPETFENLMLELGDEVRDWCNLHFFSGKLGQALICPLGHKRPIALLGCGSSDDRKSGRFFLAAAAKKLEVITNADDFDVRACSPQSAQQFERTCSF